MNNLFIDWLDLHQDHSHPLPLIGRDGFVRFDVQTGQLTDVVRCPSYRHEGSFSTSIQIRVSGCRVSVSGNPSRLDRLDNLFGFQSLDDAVRVFNRVLLSLGLPPFTRCNRTWFTQSDARGRCHQVSDGAVITRIDVTTNRAVGCGNEPEYLRALSTQRIGNSVARLHSNSMTCDWLSKLGNARHIYPSVYVKANELSLHSLPRIRARFGDDSPECQYLNLVLSYCTTHGVVRFEQKFKSAFLRKNGLCFWGLFDFAAFAPHHDSFLSIGQKMQVTVMDLEHISESLLRQGVVTSTHAANITAMYAIQWMHGSRFDFFKSQVQTHRARLRRIGIDIANPCDLTRFSVVSIRSVREVTVTDLPIPEWYQMPVVQPFLKAA